MVYYEEPTPKGKSTEDKIDAAAMAFFFLFMGIVGIMFLLGFISILWHVGFIHSVVILGVLAGLFAIGRALYLTILEKSIF